MSSEGTDPCILKSECRLLQISLLGEEVCLVSDVCGSGYRRSVDKRTCVEICEQWVTDESSGEKQCVDKCPSLYSVQDGQCVKNPLVKVVLIAVPAVVAVVAIICIAAAVVHCKRKARRQRRNANDARMRGSVVNA